MLSNKEILAEIQARRARTEAKLQEVFIPDELSALLHHVSEVKEEAVEQLAGDLKSSFRIWSDPKYTGGSGDEVYAAAGFEWYYDGSDPPYPLGFGCESFAPEPAAKKVSDKVWVKDDFLAGAELEDYVFGDSGDFEMSAVCGPFYDLVTGDDFERDAHEACADLVENLFLCHLLETLHQAAIPASKSDELASLRTTDHFYLLARNHDDLGFICAHIER